MTTKKSLKSNSGSGDTARYIVQAIIVLGIFYFILQNPTLFFIGGALTLLGFVAILAVAAYFIIPILTTEEAALGIAALIGLASTKRRK